MKRVRTVIRRLGKAYPDAACALKFSTPWELLVATVLSAQCTDRLLNHVTLALIRKDPNVRAFVVAEHQEVEEMIRRTGFYRNKTKNILGASRAVLERFCGKVPSRMEELVTIPGIGRKTANVILGNAFGIPGIPVDTHMIRINRLLKFTRHTNPVKIEFDLMRLVPQRVWTLYSHLIIHHGRVCCFARRPGCGHCGIKDLCPSAARLKLGESRLLFKVGKIVFPKHGK